MENKEGVDKVVIKADEKVLDFLECHSVIYSQEEDDFSEGYYFIPYFFRRDNDTLTILDESEIPEDIRFLHDAFKGKQDV